jgi:predicted signal transduction protein with EAL and GGDEF domain
MGIFRAPFDIDHKLHCSASVGISLFSDDDKDHLVLMQQADTAVHMAKRAGQGNHIFFRSHGGEGEEQAFLNNQLRDALRNNELVLHYQPQYRVDNGTLSGIEALLRWQQRWQHGPPAEFIPIAEETSLIRISATG